MKKYSKLTLLSGIILIAGIVISLFSYIYFIEKVGDFAEIKYRPCAALIFYIFAIISAVFSLKAMLGKETINSARIINIILLAMAIFLSIAYTFFFLGHLFQYL